MPAAAPAVGTRRSSWARPARGRARAPRRSARAKPNHVVSPPPVPCQTPPGASASTRRTMRSRRGPRSTSAGRAGRRRPPGCRARRRAGPSSRRSSAHRRRRATRCARRGRRGSAPARPTRRRPWCGRRRSGERWVRPRHTGWWRRRRRRSPWRRAPVAPRLREQASAMFAAPTALTAKASRLAGSPRRRRPSRPRGWRRRRDPRPLPRTHGVGDVEVGAGAAP